MNETAPHDAAFCAVNENLMAVSCDEHKMLEWIKKLHNYYFLRQNITKFFEKLCFQKTPSALSTKDERKIITEEMSVVHTTS